LLAAGGYAPQFSAHAFLGLVALWLLAPPVAQSALPRPGLADRGLSTGSLVVTRNI